MWIGLDGLEVYESHLVFLDLALLDSGGPTSRGFPGHEIIIAIITQREDRFWWFRKQTLRH